MKTPQSWDKCLEENRFRHEIMRRSGYAVGRRLAKNARGGAGIGLVVVRGTGPEGCKIQHIILVVGCGKRDVVDQADGSLNNVEQLA